jgi:hypothetical protein
MTQKMMGQGIGSMLSGSSSDGSNSSDGIQPMLSCLVGRGLNRDHEIVRPV